MLNWIVWNRSVYMYKHRFGINDRQLLMYHKTSPNQTKSAKNITDIFKFDYSRCMLECRKILESKPEIEVNTESENLVTSWLLMRQSRWHQIFSEIFSILLSIIFFILFLANRLYFAVYTVQSFFVFNSSISLYFIFA